MQAAAEALGLVAIDSAVAPQGFGHKPSSLNLPYYSNTAWNRLPAPVHLE